ncbi:HNH endonuclease [Loktanella salsilacus]|uniref:HNH endonuclease n=1 Tax=Loktanella salsilacus TaxID=195913 RepID=UPI0020B8653C|nr:HNH endonuclease [Loktanella salsilacus]UTH43676.1 HNH endonuclease [Loktanella salsilacus]
MADLMKLIGGLSHDHATALQWFLSRAGETVRWDEIKKYAEAGPRLVTQAKGIYKPAYMDYALSVRQTLNSPYADLDIERHENGDWYYQYFQENENPAMRDREATNRGLVRCWNDQVPVGVLIQTKPKPGVEYEVIGLAYVTNWEDGWFTLEGVGNRLYQTDGPQSEAEKAVIEVERAHQDEPFDVSSNTEMRRRAIAEVVRRQGQSKFRSQLLNAYGGRCAITGCNAIQALQAAHISPYLGDAANHVQNGLLLRADIHTLFDLGLLSIDPQSMTVILSPSLGETTYGVLQGKKLLLPEGGANRPSQEALQIHLDWTGIVA